MKLLGLAYNTDNFFGDVQGIIAKINSAFTAENHRQVLLLCYLIDGSLNLLVDIHLLLAGNFLLFLAEFGNLHLKLSLQHLQVSLLLESISLGNARILESLLQVVVISFHLVKSALFGIQSLLHLGLSRLGLRS